MSNPASSRIRHDTLGTNETSVRCSCLKSGTLTVLSLNAFMKMGASEALRLADSLCPRCSKRQESSDAKSL